MNLPHLLRHENESVLSRQLFTDLQADPILSEPIISVLQKPCGKEEILCRQEVFHLLESPDDYEKIHNLFSALKEEERLLCLIRESKIPLERYHLQADLLAAHIRVWDMLVSMTDCGKRFSEAAEYFSSDEKEHTVSEMRCDYGRVSSLLRNLHSGLVSFSGKNWITPDYDAESEYNCIADCARNLGFIAAELRERNVRADISFSDAICRLYADEVCEVENILAKYPQSVFLEPVSYIPEIQFYLDIRDLLRKAGSRGIPHCFPAIADSPRYCAREVYDVSLFAKNCENIIPNDAIFTEAEPFFFLIGANGGGKTTYLRAVGINLILFLSGCPVFAKEAFLYPFAFTASHFPQDERFDNTGRLDEERRRTEEIFASAKTKTAFLLFNETYSGADDKRGFSLLKETAGHIRESGYFGLYVTHFHEVTDTDYPILSAEIEPAGENKRTYRIVKMKGTASSYAADILKKYRLDKESLQKRRDERGHPTAETV